MVIQSPPWRGDLRTHKSRSSSFVVKNGVFELWFSLLPTFLFPLCLHPLLCHSFLSPHCPHYPDSMCFSSFFFLPFSNCLQPLQRLHFHPPFERDHFFFLLISFWPPFIIPHYFTFTLPKWKSKVSQIIKNAGRSGNEREKLIQLYKLNDSKQHIDRQIFMQTKSQSHK